MDRAEVSVRAALTEKGATSRAAPAGDGSSRLERKRRRRIREIMQVAVRLMAERGYHSISLDDIAEAMDLAKSSLYHYFPSKEELFKACLQSVGDEIHERLASVAQQPGTASERLRRLVAEQVLIQTQDYSAFAPLFLHPIQWPDGLRATVHRLRQRHDRVFLEVIRSGVASGEFTVSEPRVARLLLHGALNHIPDWYHPRQRLSPQRLATYVADATVALFTLPPRQEAGGGQDRS